MVDRCVACGEPVPEGRMVCIQCERKEKTMIRRERLYPMGEYTFAIACVHCKNVGSDICRLCKMEKVSGFELKTKKTAKVRRVKL